MPKSLPKISIIGAGAVGSVICRSLYEKGYTISSIISKTGSSTIGLAKEVQCKRVSTEIVDIADNSEVIFITVPDSAIKNVAFELSRIKKLKFKNIFVAHCSGVLTTEVLEQLEKKNAVVASMHPIQTFPLWVKSNKASNYLKNIFWGVEGKTPAIDIAEKIINSLNGRMIVISKEIKPLYHIACVFASNYMTVYLNNISELTKLLNLRSGWKETFGPIMTTTMENFIKTSTIESLTGPIVRRDFITLDMHLSYLKKNAPQFIPFYMINAIEIARIMKNADKLNQEDFKEIIRKFRVLIKKSSFRKINKVRK